MDTSTYVKQLLRDLRIRKVCSVLWYLFVIQEHVFVSVFGLPDLIRVGEYCI